MIRKFLILLFLLPLGIFAQEQPKMADSMRSDGKIYVVITVLAIIFISLAIFMVYMERKIKKLERKLEGKN